jgi:hypothetical protein
MKPMKLFGKILITMAMIPAYLAVSIENAKAITIGSIAKTATGDVVNVGGLVEVGAYVGGAILFVTGIYKIVQATQSQQPKGPALMCMIAGVALLGIGTIISAASGTFGGGGASQGLGKLGIGS